MRERSLAVAFFALALVLVGALLPSLARPAAAATTPAGFIDQKVATVGAPTALAFTPDGQMLVTTQQGKLNVYKDGVLVKEGALNLPASRLCSNSERGLLGLAVDPDFATNRQIYVYYTFNKSGQCPTSQPTNAANPVNRVSRFVLPETNAVDLASEEVLVDNMPSPAGNHNAGDLHFGNGTDKNLYVSVGDGGCDYAANSGCAGSNDAARDAHVLLGKILRITPDGAVPADNPYAATGDRCALSGRTTAGRKCAETYASGLRNPFRFAVDPDAASTRIFVNDVGQGKWEEIDEGKAGADYGWNLREGFCANNATTGCRTTPGATVSGLTDPVHAYGRDVGASITGGAFVPNGVWPGSYDSSYLFGDFVSGKIFRLSPNGSGGYTRSDFVTGVGSAVAMTFGPYNGTQALYYTSYTNGGEIHRLAHTGANRAPVASVTADPPYGPLPLTVAFDGSGSRDLDGDVLAEYLWDFDGDGTTDETTTTPRTTHEYTTAGTYEAALRVRDGRGEVSAPVAVRLDPGNTPPEPKIESPTPEKLFRVGEAITLSGSAADAEDEAAGTVTTAALPESALSWRVGLRHNTHEHPFVPPTSGNNVSFTAPAPEDLDAASNSLLVVYLTATDSKGLKRTIARELRPRKVNVALNTNPSAGIKLGLNGATFPAPRTFVSWEGYRLNVSAPAQKDGYGRSVVFAGWSDGGAASHTISTPASAATYTARFKLVSALSVSSSRTTVPYRQGAVLSGKLATTNGAPVPGKAVEVWRSTNGANWVRAGTAYYNPTLKAYRFSTPRLTRDTYFQMRFVEDSTHKGVKSRAVLLKVRR
ncbi:PKD domain-containing protein [Rubrobacter marinus]|uniref:PKD domain-containing protein n=1 Tax=Rubrobacter marinus TaxID=2653852 RepID=A0A6G8PYF9_9ACTN|nr:PQQ-dependent sugar dehydrogenase [Rubrobacter marinus]QIN79259.1 PKD domain-containing protein [Rubrobacter marinus]